MKVRGIPSQASAHAIIPALLTLLLLTTSCMYDGYNAVPQAGGGTVPFNHLSGTDTDTWIIHLPEYDNTSDSNDYSFIRVTLDDIDYEIYFSNYTDGSTSSTADYDIYRNHLYRFVTDLENVVATLDFQFHLFARLDVQRGLSLGHTHQHCGKNMQSIESASLFLLR